MVLVSLLSSKVGVAHQTRNMDNSPCLNIFIDHNTINSFGLYHIYHIRLPFIMDISPCRHIETGLTSDSGQGTVAEAGVAYMVIARCCDLSIPTISEKRNERRRQFRWRVALSAFDSVFGDAVGNVWYGSLFGRPCPIWRVPQLSVAVNNGLGFWVLGFFFSISLVFFYCMERSEGRLSMLPLSCIC